MEQIPLPSSPDSPGPPGEEHIEKDKFIKKLKEAKYDIE